MGGIEYTLKTFVIKLTVSQALRSGFSFSYESKPIPLPSIINITPMNQRMKSILEKMEDILRIFLGIVFIILGIFLFLSIFSDTTERFFRFFGGVALCSVGYNMLRLGGNATK